MKSSAINQLLDLIENQLNWGRADSWLSKDFEKLNLLILEKTKVSLSPSTLRRLWGKVDYSHQPSGTTLDTLARFAGYESWRDYTQQPEIPLVKKTVDNPVNKQFKPMLLLKIGLAVSAIIIFVVLGRNIIRPHVDASGYILKKRIITRDVPNSVVFTYDAHLSPTDSVFFQQSWDTSRRTQIDKNSKQYTSIYYRPGFYLAKLVIGQQIVKEQPILISTNGWLGMIAKKPVPVYLSQHEFAHIAELKITPAMVIAKGVALYPDPPQVEFYNVGNFKPVPLSDFSFSAAVKSYAQGGAAKCQLIKVMLITDEMPVEIPLSAPGCIASLNLYDGVNRISGKFTDLSGFGIELSDWVKVSCRTNANKIQYFVNEKLVYESKSPGVKRSILGIGFKFQYAGAVKDINIE